MYLKRTAEAALHSKYLYAFTLGLALLPGVVAGLAGIQYLQMRYFPIVDRFVITESQFNDKGDVIISGNFYKLYPDWACKYKSMQWYMPATDPDGNPVRLRVESNFGDRRFVAENNNRPEGYNEFYDWTIKISEYPDKTVFAGFVSHVCLVFIKTRTHLTEYTARPRTVMPSPKQY